ncbi:endonuclease/exonuclease/phosphatase family protein [Saccharomonospora sp. NPDC046836]|uniref:endonuclease/exonuclease/phosphatase family protein n=1 Tax=Saccharomonospora sp. NPDC046836 TaxID=3156921 RepID=UPI0033CE9243
MGVAGRTIVLVAALAAVVAGCDPDTGTPAPPASPTPTPVTPGTNIAPAAFAPDHPVPFAYAREGELTVRKSGDSVAKIDLGDGETVIDTGWSADTTRFVALTTNRLLSIDTTSGAVATADCPCWRVAVAADRVYAQRGYGARELTVYDIDDLKPVGTLRPDKVGERGMLQIAGAGDRLIAFAITADGARPMTDVLVVDPASGNSRTVGKTDQIGPPGAVAYTPQGWLGHPMVAYVTNASAGADSSKASLVWFDPARGGQHVVDDTALRAVTGAGKDANTTFEHLWWGRDGTPHVTAQVWTPDGGEVAPLASWRHDGTTWLRTSERISDTHSSRTTSADIAETRDIDGGWGLVLSREGTLRTVRGDKNFGVADDVEEVWTPPVTVAPAATSVTVVNLNAAMGYHMGAGDPAGTDATAADFADLADDLLRQNADIANLQEMAKPAAEHVQQLLADRTGQRWALNWATSGKATYYEGKSAGEGPPDGYANALAGNAQLIRIGYGVQTQSSTTGDAGTMLEPSMQQPDDPKEPPTGRSYCGVALTTADGRTLEVYVTHLARDKDAESVKRVADIRQLQEFLAKRTVPVVLTGDFNESMDVPGGGPTESVIRALNEFTTRQGFTDVGSDLGTTSNEKGPAAQLEGTLRIDYILTRDLPTVDTMKFVSHQSDHWGLVTTLVPPR